MAPTAADTPGSPLGPRFGAGLFVSIALHAMAALALVWTGQPGHDAASIADASRQEPERERVQLGIERSSHVTVSWLGFEEPTPHRVPVRAEAEQAALSTAVRGDRRTPERASSAAAAASAASASATEPSLAPPSPVRSSVATPRLDAPSPAIAQREASPESEMLSAAEGRAGERPSEVRPTPEAPEAAETAEARNAERSETKSAERDARLDPPEVELPKVEPSEVEPAEAEADAIEQEATTPADGGAADEDGLPSDREATPASDEEPIVVEPGKPAAAEGVEIRTVRPEFSATARVFFSRYGRREAVVEIAFGPDGRVKSAEFARDEGRSLRTGVPEIDRSLLDAVYRWRASGERLDELGDGERLELVMRVVLR